jgi:hypothetical protein
MDACNHFGFVVDERDFVPVVRDYADSVYVLINDGAEWEDLLILLSKHDAIETSIKCKNARVEIFRKSPSGYIPTYDYYKNGKLIVK